MDDKVRELHGMQTGLGCVGGRVHRWAAGHAVEMEQDWCRSEGVRTPTLDRD